jgi:hypothetical protein
MIVLFLYFGRIRVLYSLCRQKLLAGIAYERLCEHPDGRKLFFIFTGQSAHRG